MLQLLLLVIAAVTAVLSKLVARFFPDKKLAFSSENTIFVCLVSYKDGRWIQQCADILRAAHCPSLVRIGVVEYVRTAEASQERFIPKAQRENVKAYTLSSVVANSTQEGRKTGMEHLFSGEKFVLFCRSVDLRRGWDSYLLSNCKKHVVSTGLPPLPAGEGNVAFFPSVESARDEVLKVRHRRLHHQGERCVPSLLWQGDFSFSLSEAATHITENRSDVDVTCALAKAGFSLRVPGSCIGVRGSIPHGVRVPTNRIGDEKDPYLKKIGVWEEKVEPEAYLGLTPSSSRRENIVKYGSVAGARISLQNESIISR